MQSHDFLSVLLIFLTVLCFLAFLAGYLLGSIPFGVIFTRMAGLGDIRKIGSGNTGATNVLRTGNRKLAAATLLCDMLKGTVAVCLFFFFIPDLPLLGILAGFGAFLGHLFPIWLKFKGGKGVATYLGVLLAISWPCAMLFAAVWLITAFLTRYSSLAALVATLAVAVFAWFYAQMAIITIILMSTLIIIKHHANIRRLLNGTESKIGSKAK